MPVEISRSDLFVLAMLGCLTALLAWCAITRTLRRMWDAHVESRLSDRVAQGETEGQRIMRANSDLSLAALDVPPVVKHVAGRDPLLAAMNDNPWLRSLIGAAQRYKETIPERNQQMMRAERRSRTENERFFGD